MIRSTRLDGGLQVVTEAMPGLRSVSMGFWVDVGSRDEAPAEAGASHFLEHLLFKGTDTRSAKDIAEAVDAVGGDMNAFTTKEYTAYYLRLLDENLDLGLDILCDIMGAPAFRPDEVEAERQVILEEISMHEDEPSDVVHELFHQVLFPSHPLGREVIGERSTISAMTPDDIRSFFSSRYRPSRMVVAVAGNVDHDLVVAGIESRFGGLPGDAPPRALPGLVPPRPMKLIERHTEQAHLILGMRSLTRDDDDRFALTVLDQIMGGGMSSRLFQEIREKRGLAYSVYSFRSAYAETGGLGVYVGTAPSKAEEVVGLVSAEIDRLLDKGVTDRELEVAKGGIKGSLALALEESSGRMGRIGRSMLVHGEVVSIEDHVAKTDAVGHDDVRRVIERVLGGERVLAVVGPFSEGDFAERVA